MNKFQEFSKLANDAKKNHYIDFWEHQKNHIFEEIKQSMINGLSVHIFQEKFFNYDVSLMKYISQLLKGEGFDSDVVANDGDYHRPSYLSLNVDLINEYK